MRYKFFIKSAIFRQLSDIYEGVIRCIIPPPSFHWISGMFIKGRASQTLCGHAHVLCYEWNIFLINKNNNSTENSRKWPTQALNLSSARLKFMKKFSPYTEEVQIYQKREGREDCHNLLSMSMGTKVNTHAMLFIAVIEDAIKFSSSAGDIFCRLTKFLRPGWKLVRNFTRKSS